MGNLELTLHGDGVSERVVGKKSVRERSNWPHERVDGESKDEIIVWVVVVGGG